MEKKMKWKWLLVLALTGCSAWILSNGITLGLDIAGGMSFTVGIDEVQVREDIAKKEPDLAGEKLDKRVAEYLSDSQDRVLEVLRNRIDSLGIAEPAIFPVSGNRVTIQLPGINAERRAEAKKMIFDIAFLEFRMVHEDNDLLIGKLAEEGLAPHGYKLSMLGNQPNYVRDAKVADEEINRLALSQFANKVTGSTLYEFMLEETRSDTTVYYRPYIVSKVRELTGDYLKRAQINWPEVGLPMVDIEFNDEGARRFANITEDYAPGGAKNPSTERGRLMGIVLDGTLYSAPVIREPIYGGSAQIEGNFTEKEARLLSNVLQAGALPVPLVPVGETFVDPTLGRDSVMSGVRSGLVGAAGVLIFMFIYYFFNGLVANTALAMNVILMPVGMVLSAGFLAAFAKMFGQGAMGGSQDLSLPVLTLPGIAGIFLSVGMAVDANVLILERIREELRAGKTLYTAIRAGYDRAYITIVDANLTTVVTGVALFVFGSGPIRGYAVTLCGGILVSLFTGVWLTRLIYETMAARGMKVSLKMLQLIGQTNFDFLSRRIIPICLSATVIIATWGIMITKMSKHPSQVLGIDFTGGASITLDFKDKADVSAVRDALLTEGIGDTYIQYQQDAQVNGVEQLKVRVGGQFTRGEESAGAAVEKALQKHLPTGGYAAVLEENVGPQISGELIRKAGWAAFWSVLGIIVYLSIRFEFGFALGAIVAVLHDVAVGVGIYTLLDRQLNLTIIAAMLTIVGYSVNDTIVIFDRIREGLRSNRHRSFKDICNQSINETLSRTILTTGATLFVVVSMMVVGGGEVREFATVLFIGMIAGTYSTIFIATPVLLGWYRNAIPELGAKKTT